MGGAVAESGSCFDGRNCAQEIFIPSMGRAVFLSKSLFCVLCSSVNLYSINGQGCVPSLLFGKAKQVRVMEVMVTSFKRKELLHCCNQCP